MFRKLLLITTLISSLLLCSCEDMLYPAASDGTVMLDNTTRITFSKHALCRMDCRHIDSFEIREVLQNGSVNSDKTRYTDQGKSLAYEGITRDNQHIRVVASPKSKSRMHIVTVIDLDTDWQCDCK